MTEIRLRPMERRDRPAVAALIETSFNGWYTARGMPAAFKSGSGVTRLLCELYETLDPGCGVLARDSQDGPVLGACFYHPRESHIALGPLGVHPDAFGRGVGGRLLGYVIDLAERAQKPLRLLSSAANTDSFALYTRAGFVPRAVFQGMFIKVPENGLHPPSMTPLTSQVRPATAADIPALLALEQDIAQISRERDYRHVIENPAGLWHVSVYENERHDVVGFLVSFSHPGRAMLGPGAMRTPEQAAALILAGLNRHRGRRPVLLVPVECQPLVGRLYAWGARVFELYLHQVRGAYRPSRGVLIPALLPETG